MLKISPGSRPAVLYSDHAAKEKIAASIIKRSSPETGTGAFPERLGSSGTAKTPHIDAASTGMPMARIKRIPPSPCFQPQKPIAARLDNSSRNLNAKLIECEPKMGAFFL